MLLIRWNVHIGLRIHFDRGLPNFRIIHCGSSAKGRIRQTENALFVINRFPYQSGPQKQIYGGGRSALFPLCFSPFALHPDPYFLRRSFGFVDRTIT